MHIDFLLNKLYNILYKDINKKNKYEIQSN